MLKERRQAKYDVGREMLNHKELTTHFQFTIPLTMLLFFGFVPTSWGQSRRIELEVVMESGFPVGEQFDWLREMETLGADHLRIRSAKRSDRMGIREVKSERLTTYKITGVLTGGNRLKLPGGTYRISQLASAKRYLDKLRKEGFKDSSETKLAFGLNEKELVALHESLGQVVGISTKQKKPAETLANISKTSGLDLQFHESCEPAFAEGEPIKEEFKTLSVGTSIAAICRPLGLVLAPVKRKGKPLTLYVVESSKVDEHWPVGWPTKESPGALVPTLVERIEVDISDYPLNQVLDAVEDQAKIPFVYDLNSLARRDVELSKIKVNIPKRNEHRSKVIRRAMAQAKAGMYYELRVDEAGTPFVWITATVKK